MIEEYHFWQKTFMWGIAIFGILTILSTLGWNQIGLKIKDLEKQSKEKINPKEKTTVKNTFQIQGDFVKGNKKESKSEVINAPNAIIVTTKQSGGNNTVNYYQNDFKAPISEIDNSIRLNIQTLLKLYPNPPLTIIEIESGNSQRNKVAMQLESYLKPNNLGNYPKGNTSMGRFPDYPVTVFFNPQNRKYIEELLNQ